MADVSISELREHSGRVLGRVEAGERIAITRAGRPVAELHPVARRGPDPTTLLDRWRRLPDVDASALRRDVDLVTDPAT